MASRLKRACRYNRCPNLTDDQSGYCDKHKAQVHVDYRNTRTDIDEQKFYRTQAWRNASLQHRKEHPICQECKVRPSVLVHHIKPVREGGERFAKSNLQAVCRSCQGVAHHGNR